MKHETMAVCNFWDLHIETKKKSKGIKNHLQSIQAWRIGFEHFFSEKEENPPKVNWRIP